MRVYYNDTAARYEAESSYDERFAMKDARWRWDPTAKKWWTDKDDKAALLREHMDKPALAKLGTAFATVTKAVDESRAMEYSGELPCPDGLAYLPYQEAGAGYMLSRKGTLLGDDMGLGKTIQALAAINAEPFTRLVLVVCPNTLKLNWAKEARKWLIDRDLAAAIHVVTAKDSRFDPRERMMVIMNYDILHKHEAALRLVDWDVLIVDEAHLIKNPKARRTKHILGYKPKRGAKSAERTIAPIRAKRRMFLTGTPMQNRPIEIQGLAASLAPNEPRFAFWPFVQRFCNPKKVWTGKKNVWDFSGASHLDDLQRLLRSTIMIRRLKKDVLPDLPPKRRQVIELTPNGASNAIKAEAAHYARIEDELHELAYAVEIAKTSENASEYAEAVAKLRAGVAAAFTQMSLVRHETARRKVPAIIEHIDSALEDPDHKIVLFAHHRDVMAAFVEHFGDRCAQVHGDISTEGREEAVTRFQNDPSCQLFVGQTIAAGVGLTLTASAHVIFAELDWVPANLTQAEDRTHRIGQEAEFVLVQHFVYEGSLDAVMAERVVEKQGVIDAALDDLVKADLAAQPLVAAPKVENGATQSASKKQIAELAEKMTPERIAAVHEGLKQLSIFCDGAQSLDGMGFSKLDTRIGHELAHRNGLSPKQAALGYKLVNKYRRQLPESILTPAGVGARKGK